VSDKDFVVKNGLQVNNGVWVVNTAGIYYNSELLANSTFFAQEANTAINANTANNASNLGDVEAAKYLTNFGNYTVSGNINFTGSNVNFTTIKSGANTVANNTGFYYNGESVQGGGYYKGNDGTRGEEARKADLYRINANTQTADITISAGENALTVGPITVDEGFNLTVETGGRVVVI
jgi:hypothetical protein